MEDRYRHPQFSILHPRNQSLRLRHRANGFVNDIEQSRQLFAPIVSGGIRITISPSGRISTPRLRASRMTLWPIRSSGAIVFAVGFILHQLDADHVAPLAHIAHMRQSEKIFLQPLLQVTNARLHFADDIFPLE